jgi:hypothetical protein
MQARSLPGRLDASFAHPWLRNERVLREILSRAWDDHEQAELRARFQTVWRERRQVRTAGWFN